MENRSKSIQQACLGLTLGIVLAFGIVAATAREGKGDVSPQKLETVNRSNSKEAVSVPLRNETPKDRTKTTSVPLSPEQQEEIRRLRAEVDDLERTITGNKTIAEKMRFAKETYEMFLDVVRKGDVEGLIQILSRLGDLDEETALYFYDRYHEDRPNQEKELALFLGLFCGGPNVSEMMSHALRSDLSVKKEDSMLELIYESLMDEIKPFPVDDALARIAQEGSRNPDPNRRMKAVLVLKRVDSDESRQRLQMLMANDPETAVRKCAIRALGNNGDRNTLAALKIQLSLLGADVPDLKTFVANLNGELPDPTLVENVLLSELIRKSIGKIELRISR